MMAGSSVSYALVGGKLALRGGCSVLACARGARGGGGFCGQYARLEAMLAFAPALALVVRAYGSVRALTRRAMFRHPVTECLGVAAFSPDRHRYQSATV